MSTLCYCGNMQFVVHHMQDRVVPLFPSITNSYYGIELSENISTIILSLLRNARNGCSKSSLNQQSQEKFIGIVYNEVGICPQWTLWKFVTYLSAAEPYLYTSIN